MTDGIDSLPTDAGSSAHAATGYVLDAALAGGAVSAWLLPIEQIIGGIGAALIFGLAIGTALFRFLYWRQRYRKVRDDDN